MFKNSGGGQYCYHITKESGEKSLCGHYKLLRNNGCNKFQPKKLERDWPVYKVIEASGLGKNVCKKCQRVWKGLD